MKPRPVALAMSPLHIFRQGVGDEDKASLSRELTRSSVALELAEKAGQNSHVPLLKQLCPPHRGSRCSFPASFDPKVVASFL